jgi:hypothetical protein
MADLIGMPSLKLQMTAESCTSLLSPTGCLLPTWRVILNLQKNLKKKRKNEMKKIRAFNSLGAHFLLETVQFISFHFIGW